LGSIINGQALTMHFQQSFNGHGSGRDTLRDLVTGRIITFKVN
jgi:hypothetical protein